jgi:DNA mismatch repair protein MutS2
MKPGTGLSGTKDIGTLVQQAALGHTLEPQELLDVQATLAVSRTAHETIERLRAYMPFLAEIADGIGDFRELTTAIGRSISGTGEVLDSASPVLAQLRREPHCARPADDASTSFSAPGSPLSRSHRYPRDGRYVIPVKAEMRSQMPGIVHDVSSSGATVFLEPLETVEMGNKWRELLAEEEREIARILRDLSAHVGRLADAIAEAIEALARIDLSLAKAKLGKTMGADELPHDPPSERRAGPGNSQGPAHPAGQARHPAQRRGCADHRLDGGITSGRGARRRRWKQERSMRS